jgi:V/A-type H+-transporting ATPase subunit A
MGKVISIKGEIIRASGISGRMYETVRIGDEGYGEIIDILGEGRYAIQVFTNPEGLSVGEKVEALGKPITVQVGPHLIGHFFDGPWKSSLSTRPQSASL